MPGPISDAFDPEFGTGAKAAEVSEALDGMYRVLTDILDGSPPLPILDLVRVDLPRTITAQLTEKQWRLLRFALEFAKDSI